MGDRDRHPPGEPRDLRALAGFAITIERGADLLSHRIERLESHQDVRGMLKPITENERDYSAEGGGLSSGITRTWLFSSWTKVTWPGTA